MALEGVESVAFFLEAMETFDPLGGSSLELLGAPNRHVWASGCTALVLTLSINNLLSPPQPDWTHMLTQWAIMGGSGGWPTSCRQSRDTQNIVNHSLTAP